MVGNASPEDSEPPHDNRLDGAPEDMETELAVLGRVLEEHSEEIVTLLKPLTPNSIDFGTVGEADFAGAAVQATLAVAHWMQGRSIDEASKNGLIAASVFGRLAAEAIASLDELTRRCLKWRDISIQLLSDYAFAHQMTAATPKAIQMLNRSTDATLVRMSTSFEQVRQHLRRELAEHQRELAFQATHDPLTSLPNRNLLRDRIHQMLLRSRRTRLPVSVLFLDIDNFKAINDTFGHNGGDELIKAVTRRLSQALRSSDTLGRLGGDEFVVAAEPSSTTDDETTIARRLVASLHEPFILPSNPNQQIRVTASIGVASGIDEEPDELLRNADIAMYKAKSSGKNRFVIFAPEMSLQETSLPGLGIDLGEAFIQNRFYLDFQPAFDLNTMRVVAMEALIRYEHPTRGTITARELIPFLTEANLLIEVGRWVLHEACRQAAQWRDSGYQTLVVINVSDVHLNSDGFLTDVSSALKLSGLPGYLLGLDLNEAALLHDIETSQQLLKSLKKFNIHLIIDDFGKEFISVAQLRHLPVDQLKIDGALVLRLLDTVGGEEITRSLFNLGKALGINTMAKGIERRIQLNELLEEKCSIGQGFLLSKPIAAKEVLDFLETSFENQSFSN
ncbi:MAG: EAL domain-containing protein [Firmicutes bacterium]|nr:EAL domain-containing protein [Bacillota bacterium]